MAAQREIAMPDSGDSGMGQARREACESRGSSFQLGEDLGGGAGAPGGEIRVGGIHGVEPSCS